MTETRPTEADKAAAVLRLMDELDAAHAAINGATRLLGEGRERGTSRPVGPLFPFGGDEAYRQINAARQALWKAREAVAVQFLDSMRASAD